MRDPNTAQRRASIPKAAICNLEYVWRFDIAFNQLCALAAAGCGLRRSRPVAKREFPVLVSSSDPSCQNDAAHQPKCGG